ncbi:pyrophosphatase PpaX [Virgibacillus natechei]|uniref:Pyrophosphatase PpaX n=1 Tax=Virgibacillus natechei TaxID=1216297 RepID=A0ABS4IEN2_9BACI|nr:pyrophosphatase PpaX [Virgibacillus natechei]MBP1969412.1 pyrophosphatase PpaX [Virgibacillus natechei]UZD11874.1 pyrophosphatase PpaX [Virgibacillus natechei]
MNIHTILFDLDGTLIDTNELIFASFDHTFKQYNLSFTREELAEFNGPPLIETLKKIDPVRAENMIATYREHNHANHDKYVTAFPQVTDTIYQLKSKGIKLGIVSTKMSEAVKMGLALTELDTFFESVITLDDVTQAKPHPEPIWKALEDLQADPATTLMVGDNHHDIEAGQNAHVQTAGVAWSQKGKERLLEYDPTYMLEEMHDLLKIIEV